MKTLLFLFTLLLVQQGTRPEFGTIRGRLTTVNGGPASMVRVALALPDTDAITELTHIGQTDAAGLYELVGVLPGRYRIVAGPVNAPTFYPGVATPDQARIVTIGAGEVLTDLGFVVLPGFTPALGTSVSGGSGTVTGKVRVDDSSPLPSMGLPFLHVEVNGGLVARVAGPTGTFLLQVGSRDLRVTLGPLPLGYYLKSFTYGNVDLTTMPLTLPASSNPTEIEVVLTKTRPENAPRRARVTGHVTRGEGALNLTRRPLELFRVGPRGGAFYAATVMLAANDTFSIEDVPTGRYHFGPNPMGKEFEVGANDVTGLTVHLGEPETVVPLNARSLRTVRGTIEGLGDTTVPRFEIAFIPARTAATAHVVIVTGKEFSGGVPEGEYRISVSGLPESHTVVSVTAGPLDLTSPFLLTNAGIADRFTGKATPAGITIRLSAVRK